MATLTGAIIVCLGSEYLWTFSNDENLSNQIFSAGEKVEEKVWKCLFIKTMTNLWTQKTLMFKILIMLAVLAQLLQRNFYRFILNKTPWAHLDMPQWLFQNMVVR